LHGRSFTYSLTITDRTLRNLPVVGQTGIRKALKVLFGRFRPTFPEMGALGLGVEVVADNILAVQLALKVNEADGVVDLLLLYKQPFSIQLE
jgi:hypothetical protein